MAIALYVLFLVKERRSFDHLYLPVVFVKHQSLSMFRSLSMSHNDDVIGS
jgi:hypothetical protein